MRMSDNKDMVESVVRDVGVINIITTYDASRINSRFHIVMDSERVGICAYAGCIDLSLDNTREFIWNKEWHGISMDGMKVTHIYICRTEPKITDYIK